MIKAMQHTPAAALRAWSATVLDACGLAADDAALGARVLVRANLRAVDTHGVSRLPVYARLLRTGAMDARGACTTIEEPGVLQVDAATTLGQVAGARAIEAVLARLTTSATCTVVLRRVGHLGALGVLASMLAEAGMVGLVMQNGPPVMGLPGATAPAVGNNPMAFAAPVPDGPPLVVDIATSDVAFGRVIDAARTGASLQPGWALDATGQPTTDPAAVLAGGMLSPMAAHKGIGLALMVETLAGALSGTRPTAMQGAMLPPAFGGFIYALNPALAGGPGFAAHLLAALATLHASGPDVRYPGERAAAIEAERERNGVPLPPAVRAELDVLADSFGVGRLP